MNDDVFNTAVSDVFNFNCDCRVLFVYCEVCPGGTFSVVCVSFIFRNDRIIAGVQESRQCVSVVNDMNVILAGHRPAGCGVVQVNGNIACSVYIDCEYLCFAVGNVLSDYIDWSCGPGNCECIVCCCVEVSVVACEVYCHVVSACSKSVNCQVAFTFNYECSVVCAVDFNSYWSSDVFNAFEFDEFLIAVSDVGSVNGKCWLYSEDCKVCCVGAFKVLVISNVCYVYCVVSIS